MDELEQLKARIAALERREATRDQRGAPPKAVEGFGQLSGTTKMVEANILGCAIPKRDYEAEARAKAAREKNLRRTRAAAMRVLARGR
jgi:hypothetical protein